MVGRVTDIAVDLLACGAFVYIDTCEEDAVEAEKHGRSENVG